MKRLFTLIILCFSLMSIYAQYPTENPKEDIIRTMNFPALKRLQMTPIAGAPILSQPLRIDGTEMEIRTVKHGLCYPALYDWNHDGKKDLILGEFSTGDTQSDIKIYLNEGTDKKPVFSGRYSYGRDIKGDTISFNQFCCIGIHPRFVDLDGDGYLDILSGQYSPGQVAWWRGSKDGFLPIQFVPQEGYVPQEKYMANYTSQDVTSPNNREYWTYTSIDLADYNGDGLPDLFVGGEGGMRVALNVGTKELPKFGLRKYLYLVDGNVLSFEGKDVAGGHPAYLKSYMTPIDWDGDGVLDILATNEYDRKGSHAVYFFKGVKTNLGIRFKKAVPLFTVVGGGKELPGCQPMITVGDYNGDGVKDLLLGISIPTIHGYEAADSIAWKWIDDLAIPMPGKDMGEYYMYTTLDSLIHRVQTNSGDRGYMLGNLKDLKYLTTRHRGYVFVFYGKKNPIRAKKESVHVNLPKPIPTKSFNDNNSSAQNPVTYNAIVVSNNDYQCKIDAVLSFAKGWHGYTNDKEGMIPTTISFETSDVLQKAGDLDLPYVGASPFYQGQVVFHQFFNKNIEKLKNSADASIPVKVKIRYQVCNDKMCLPPEEHTIVINIPLNIKKK